ncbi:MAG: helix-turn-helix transcriptional regulator [Puia sp.]
MSIAAQNLKYLRKLRGWTQEEFASKLKIKRSLLGAYEEERAEPRLEVLELVSDMFRLSLDELLRKKMQDAKGGNYLAKTTGSKNGRSAEFNPVGAGQSGGGIPRRLCRS